MYCLKYSQKFPVSVAESWEFFSSPKNLKSITPSSIRFEILNVVDEKMYPGQIISYSIRPLWNIPIHWVTEITHVQQHHYFIDEQKAGPFRLWHHEHRFRTVPGGTEISDTIHYIPPLGPIGKLLNTLKIKKDLEAIFTYRRNVLEKIFGAFAGTCRESDL